LGNGGVGEVRGLTVFRQIDLRGQNVLSRESGTLSGLGKKAGILMALNFRVLTNQGATLQAVDAGEF
jgi:hypothetical protein